ncbi:DNA primase [Candidatus Johnevansia muelleri]|uniref:DNA primase n=1 Tax=Candidatus Johnevansia muelleri TaxID=1495769 RepID=A0A078KI45_9GAMM|nr:DNA primase [Candidatus Evansia muelleri]
MIIESYKKIIKYIILNIDIVEFISEKIKLKKYGKNFIGSCPFHKEKNPSFTVYKNFYHCFGCCDHGNVIKFIMKYDKLNFFNVISILANKLGIKIENFKKNESNLKNLEGYNLLFFVTKYFCNMLNDSSFESKKARAYLKFRGINKEMIKNYSIGYANKSWDSLKKYLNKYNFSEKLQIKYGLLIKNSNTLCYDIFRNRIIFPIKNFIGRTIGFGGRVLVDKTPKYINSPETPIFFKGHELYGLFELRQKILDIKWLLIVEGYIDVITLSQRGIYNVIATLGTTITIDQLKIIYKLVDKIIFCFDGDIAGYNASCKALDVVLLTINNNLNKTIKFIILPFGEDPDSLIIKEGLESFKIRIKKANNLSDFIFKIASKGLNIKLIEDQQFFIKKVLEYLINIPECIFKLLIFNKLEKISNISINILKKIYNNLINKYNSKTNINKNIFYYPSLRLLQLLLHYPYLIKYLPKNNYLYPTDEYGILLVKVIKLFKYNNFKFSNKILNNFILKKHILNNLLKINNIIQIQFIIKEINNWVNFFY